MPTFTSTFNPDLDTWITSADPTSNHDTENLQVGWRDAPQNDIRRSLMRFNLFANPLSGPALIAASIVSSASLAMWTDTRVGGAWTGTLNRITTTTWIEEGATYNVYRPGQDWATPGGDFTTTGAVAFTASASSTFLTISGLGSLTQDAVTSRSGFLHLLMKGDTESGAGDFWAAYADAEQSTASQRPILTVVFSSPGASAITRMGLMSRACRIDPNTGTCRSSRR